MGFLLDTNIVSELRRVTRRMPVSSRGSTRSRRENCS